MGIQRLVRVVFSELKQPVKPRYQNWKIRGGEKLLSQSGALFWTGHSMRHVLPSISASIGVTKDRRDFVGRWHVNLHQSADYIHTSRQVVMEVQEAVNKSICQGSPSYDESELMDDFGHFLKSRGEPTAGQIARHGIWKSVEGELLIGGTWPLIDVDVVQTEILEEVTAQTSEPANTQLPEEGGGDDAKSNLPFFVSISRHSGFRRLHKFNACGTMPWNCRKVEWLSEVKEGCADAVCKVCKRSIDSSSNAEPESSSTSGSSSSTKQEADDDGPIDGGSDALGKFENLNDTSWEPIQEMSPSNSPLRLVSLVKLK